jgi:hypothetical protein
MGNTYSATTQRSLATAAMAKYMHLTKPQLMRLRDTVLPYSKTTQGQIQRSYIEYGLSQSLEQPPPRVPPANTSDKNKNHTDNNDAVILGHLFTLCDTGHGRVDCMEFIVGISILACKTDSFEVALRFALRVLDVTGVGEIDSRNAFKMLKGESVRATASCGDILCLSVPCLTLSRLLFCCCYCTKTGICTVASCFGDPVPSSRELYKLVDCLFDAVSLVSAVNDGIAHDRFVRRLVAMPLVKQYILVLSSPPPRPGGAGSSGGGSGLHPVAAMVSTKNLLDSAIGLSDDSANDEQDTSLSLDQYLPSQYNPRPGSFISPASGTQSTSVDSLNSHMSSLMLTPLAQIPISQ